MLKRILSLIFLFCIFASNLKASETACLGKHIRDAIKINNERQLLYKQQSTKASRLFKKLIALEWLMLLPSDFFDVRALKYNKKGHGLFCHDLVSMENIPPFSGKGKAPKDNFIPISNEKINSLKDSLYRALDQGALKFGQALAFHLGLLNQHAKEYQCLTRHFLESMARTTSLWEKHRNEAEARDLPSPDRLIESYLKNHILALGFMANLDREAGPIQKEGLAIFCQDVPPIPWQ